MRRWQVWFFSRWGQVLFWLVVLVVGWMFLRFDTGRPRWWWPFERSRSSMIDGSPRSYVAVEWSATGRTPTIGVGRRPG
jgi:hypothetical protein